MNSLLPVVETYLLAMPNASRETVISLVDGAAERARAKHADFDRFLPGIEHLATVFFTDHRRMPLDDYLESLYCAVKHGDFSKSWRLQLKQPLPPAPVN
jgi:hypothetical protein